MMLEPRLPYTNETDAHLEAAGLETLDYSARWKLDRIRVTEKDPKVHEQLFRDLITMSRDHRER